MRRKVADEDDPDAEPEEKLVVLLIQRVDPEDLEDGDDEDEDA